MFILCPQQIKFLQGFVDTKLLPCQSYEDNLGLYKSSVSLNMEVDPQAPPFFPPPLSLSPTVNTVCANNMPPIHRRLFPVHSEQVGQQTWPERE